MIGGILKASIHQPLIVILAAGLLMVWGMMALERLPVDAFPDVTTVQVQVLTEAPGLSPIEVERLITFPVELEMAGLPGQTEIRSLSKSGLSQVTVVFEDQVDMYRARQLVLERLIEAKGQLPSGAEPTMAPITTGLGEVFQYFVARTGISESADRRESEDELMEQRTLQDWVIRPFLRRVPGVVDVNSLGGFVKQYHVLVDAARLRKYDLSLHGVFQAIARNNANAGGNILEERAEKYLVRGVGLIRNLTDVENVVVKESGGTPVFVRDVAEVRVGHAVRNGAAVLNGNREVVAGIVLMLRGANAHKVVGRIKEKVDELNRGGILPPGYAVRPFYDRSELVTAALSTVRKVLLEGIVLVVIVLFAFLGDVRSALIVTATLIAAPLGTFIVMERLGVSANLMSLGGLAIAVGMIVDGSVVIVENAHRVLTAWPSPAVDRPHTILQASQEVGRPVVFAVLIIVIVFLPLYSLQGLEGKLFSPMAYTIMIALMFSLVFSLTVTPALCAMALRAGKESDTRFVRWAKTLYAPVLTWSLHRPVPVLTIAVGLLAGGLALLPTLGGEFIPVLDEGALTPQIIRLPGISLAASVDLEKRVHRALLEFPEVKLVVGKIGRSEIATSPEEANESDPVVLLHPRHLWKTAQTKEELVEAIRRRLADIPGVTILMSQPIQERVDELVSGVKTEVAIKLFGYDLDVLKTKGEEIAEILKTVRGVADIKVEEVMGQTYLTVDIDRQKIARHGINVADVQDIVETAIGGKRATQILEGEQRWSLIVRFPQEQRNSVEVIGNILVKDPSGALIPLADIATITLVEGPVQISREQSRRRLSIGFNIVGRDVKGVVEEGRQKLAARLVLPPNYTMVWAGTFENMERAMARLQIIVPLTVGLIFVLLFLSFRSLRHASLIILNLPFSLIGGIGALWLTGQYLSVPASVGFIALFGVAVLNGIVLVSYINKLRLEGLDTEEAVISGSLMRLRPVVMTALVAFLGLLPLALERGIGSEVQRPLATVVMGGLLSSTALTLIVLPTLYPFFERFRIRWPGWNGGSRRDSDRA